MSLRAQLHLVWRRLARSPGFAAMSVATLAIGIAANAAIFTVVNAVLLRPLPVPASEQLVVLQHVVPGLAQLSELPMSDALYFLYARESRTLEGVSLFSNAQASFTGADNPQRVPAAAVTASFFEVMRTPPRIGRAFTEADERRGAPPVAIVSDGLWHARYGADPTVVGRLVDLGGERTEIVGVMPAVLAFAFPEVELWVPQPLDETDTTLGGFGMIGMARMADGATLEQVRAELVTMTSNLVEVFPDEGAAKILGNAGFRPIPEPAHELMVGDVEVALWMLLGAVGVLLLIACANVANLFLARAEARHQEVAVRFALGESRGRLMASFLMESVTLGLAAGIVALPVALGVTRALVGFGPEGLPRLAEISVDGVVLAFGLGVSIVAGLLFGVLPALRAGAIAASDCVAGGMRGATAGRRRHLARRGLVVAQIALALTLLVGSGLAVRSFQRMMAVDPGLDPVDVLTLGVAIPAGEYATADARLAFHRGVIDGLLTVPGVTTAAAASTVPLSGTVQGSGHWFEGDVRTEGDLPAVFMTKRISPGYFTTLGIDLLKGRDFERLDHERGRPVVIVSRSVAETYWPGESALGKGITSGDRPDDAEGWFRIIGVVDDVTEVALHEAPPEMAYYPLSDTGRTDGVPNSLSYLIRGAGADRLTTPAREVVRRIDPSLPVSDIETLETIVARASRERSFVTSVLIIAGGLALLLGSVGLYGVISYMVAQRRQEIAIRMAVGASIADVRRLVFHEAGLLAVAGTLLGAGAAVAVTRRLQALWYETSPLDPTVFLAVSALLVGVCLLASWVPARRAALIDPAGALSAE